MVGARPRGLRYRPLRQNTKALTIFESLQMRVHHSLEPFKLDSEVLSHSLSVSQDPGVSPDDVGRWSIPTIKEYQHDYQIKTYVDGCLASVMFYKWYDDFLRINIGMYVLKKYRKDLYRFQFYPEGGCFALVQSKVPKPLGYFGTFYPKNKKLAALVESLKSRRHRGLGSPTSAWDNFAIYHDEPIKVRSVLQWVMYLNERGDQDTNLAKLYRVLGSLQTKPVCEGGAL